MDNYIPVIGLEIHVELNTKSKMFCGCSANYFGQKPNTHTCPTCLGLPGALPFTNEQALKNCIQIGLALNCQIEEISRFERKNYFYPDLPKGYQISQYRSPLCTNGWIEVKDKVGKKNKIRINRVHQEEDTAKLIHVFGNPNFQFSNSNKKVTLIDFNRSGVPLVEIVTEPDFHNVEEVKDYAKKIQQICRYLNVSNADMEKGNMRLEANISLRQGGEKLPNYRVELKNINSFRFMEEAILYEIKRQTQVLEKGEKLNQETRGWNENAKKTYIQRTKEEAHDYRYFPEPDIPPIQWTEYQISSIRQAQDKNQRSELPQEKLERFIKQYELSEYDAEILTREKQTADYFEESVKTLHQLSTLNSQLSTKNIANWIINKKPDLNIILPAELINQIISAKQVVKIDEKEIKEILDKIFLKNPKILEDYKKGKVEVLGFVIGQVKGSIKQKIDILSLKSVIEKILKTI